MAVSTWRGKLPNSKQQKSVICANKYLRKSKTAIRKSTEVWKGLHGICRLRGDQAGNLTQFGNVIPFIIVA
jgi:hypothetical protein